MAPAVSECSSVDSEGSEASPMSSPRVCRCQNQLAHWDWAGRLHPNLPECCRPANGKGPGDVAVDDDPRPATATEDVRSLTAQSDVDFEQEARPEEQARLKDPKENTNEQPDAAKGINKDLADKKTCDRKRKRGETSGGRTCKKSKNTTSISIDIKFNWTGVTQSSSSVKVSVTMDRSIKKYD